MFDFTDKNPRFFYKSSDFDFLNPLVSNYPVIKAELLHLLKSYKTNEWFKNVSALRKIRTAKIMESIFIPVF